MPRRNTFPPYPRRPHTGSGQARIKLRGKHVYLGVWNSPASHEEYRRLLTQWEATRAAGLPQAPLGPVEAPTVAYVVARFLVWAEENCNPRSRELTHFRMALEPLLVLYGPEPAAGLDALKLEALRDSLPSGRWQPDPAQRSSWNQTTANRHLCRIKTCWQWAEKHKLVPPGSHGHLRLVKGLPRNRPGLRLKRKRRLPTWEQVEKVLPKVAVPVAALLELQYRTGARTTELLIARTCDLDRTGDVWLYRPSWHKNDWRGQERVIVLDRRCQEVVRPFLLEGRPEEWLFRPLNRVGRPKDGRRYSNTGYAQALRRGCKAAGVAPFDPYDLRHAAKMRFVRLHGADTARALLGQKSIEALAHYGDLDLEAAIDAARKGG